MDESTKKNHPDYENENENEMEDVQIDNANREGDKKTNFLVFLGTIARNGKCAPIDITDYQLMPEDCLLNMLEVVKSTIVECASQHPPNSQDPVAPNDSFAQSNKPCYKIGGKISRARRPILKVKSRVVLKSMIRGMASCVVQECSALHRELHGFHN
ncbi:hypothetical protein M9H77_02565 [Catharanthus roseus]|uniref:Uncharacterized protein n=1 Tax=Catharanthus roseus TaxID=4058 RepID=A0ACC0C8N4_CATRO|nr:hypothetical protein M9H77_02565 [Catharanthus roseus]